MIYGEKVKNKLNEFKNLLLLWNNKFNLTSITDEKEIEIKHFEDSILNEKFFKKSANVVEVGSGGGFPSIPLMCYREDLKFTLVESVGKKCTFLTECVDKLGLNAQVINKRAEDVGKDIKYRERFDVVTARAVAPLNTLIEYCLPLIKVGGVFVAYKGENCNEEEICKNALLLLGGKIIKKENYSLSENFGNRTVYVIEKIKKTPEKYPRGNGKERKNPL